MSSATSSGSSSCNCDPGCNYNGAGILITNKIVSSTCGVLKISGGGVCHVTGQGKLTVNSDFEVNGGSRLIISNGDSVIVSGNFTISGGSSVNVVGGAYFRVNGSVTLSGSSNVCGPGGSGTISYGGSLSGSGWNGCTGTLPIELMFFKAKFEDKKVDFSWATASEVNNDYFAIERSTDGINFEEVLRIAGAGNSTSRINYSESDQNPVRGTSYYRLKQTDYNGVFTYSPIEFVNTKESEISSETFDIDKLFSNLDEGSVKFTFNVSSGMQLAVQILNGSGQIVYSSKINAEQGYNEYEISGLNFTTGIYYLILTNNEKKVLRKIVRN